MLLKLFFIFIVICTFGSGFPSQTNELSNTKPGTTNSEPLVRERNKRSPSWISKNREGKKPSGAKPQEHSTAYNDLYNDQVAASSDKGKAAKSVKSGKIDKSGQSGKVDKSSPSGKIDKSGQSGKIDKSGQSGKIDKSGQSGKIDKSGQSGRSDSTSKEKPEKGSASLSSKQKTGSAHDRDLKIPSMKKTSMKEGDRVRSSSGRTSSYTKNKEGSNQRTANTRSGDSQYGYYYDYRTQASGQNNYPQGGIPESPEMPGFFDVVPQGPCVQGYTQDSDPRYKNTAPDGTPKDLMTFGEIVGGVGNMLGNLNTGPAGNSDYPRSGSGYYSSGSGGYPSTMSGGYPSSTRNGPGNSGYQSSRSSRRG